MARRHDEDYRRYQELLEATRDADGVEDREQARKQLAEEPLRLEELVQIAEALEVPVTRFLPAGESSAVTS